MEEIERTAEIIRSFQNQEAQKFLQAEEEKRRFERLNRVRHTKHVGSKNHGSKTKRRAAAKRARTSRKGNR